MAPKRKSDAIEQNTAELLLAHVSSDTSKPVGKKARVSNASTSEGKDKATSPTHWWEVKLEGEGDPDVDIPIFDDCNDIRRKIRALLQTPGFKVTEWLQQIGKVNSNSYGRFMKASGPYGGASNGTYYCAYVYFEKVRIAEGKKKTAKRVKAEKEHATGMPQENKRGRWV